MGRAAAFSGASFPYDLFPRRADATQRVRGETIVRHSAASLQDVVELSADIAYGLSEEEEAAWWNAR